MIIQRAFNVLDGPALYIVKFGIYITAGTGGLTLRTFRSDGPGFEDIFSRTISTAEWFGVHVTSNISEGYNNLNILLSTSGGGNAAGYIKNLQVIHLKKAEAQDSDLFGGGRRFSYYEGCKMTSQDYNVNSPDTADGGPVITVNTVAANTPSSSPLGSSIGTSPNVTPPQE